MVARLCGGFQVKFEVARIAGLGTFAASVLFVVWMLLGVPVGVAKHKPYSAPPAGELPYPPFS